MCYVKISKTIQSLLPKTRSREKATRLVGWVITAFFVCWTPYYTMKIFSAFCWATGVCHSTFGGALRHVFDLVYPFAISLAFFNSCLNPILYAFSLDNFNDSLIKVSKQKFDD